MTPIVADFRGENQQTMYLGFWRLGARKPAPLLGVGENCAPEVSKSGQTMAPGAADHAKGHFGLA
ncbi:MAG TPA: hypothetical protein PLO34_09970, partial [Pseudoxanthomonas sp.]|nr:hypothetical protein [Pseudoxanthomonas sp.]